MEASSPTRLSRTLLSAAVAIGVLLLRVGAAPDALHALRARPNAVSLTAQRFRAISELSASAPLARRTRNSGCRFSWRWGEPSLAIARERGIDWRASAGLPDAPCDDQRSQGAR